MSDKFKIHNDVGDDYVVDQEARYAFETKSKKAEEQLCVQDIVSSLVLPIGLHFKSDTESFHDDMRDAILKSYSIPDPALVPRFKLVHVDHFTNDEDTSVLTAVFTDEDDNPVSYSDMLKRLPDKQHKLYYITQGFALRCVTHLVRGEFTEFKQYPMTTTSLKSELCFCDPCVRHLPGMNTEFLKIDEQYRWMGCDMCERWCHRDCLIEFCGLEKKDVYTEDDETLCRPCLKLKTA